MTKLYIQFCRYLPAMTRILSTSLSIPDRARLLCTLFICYVLYTFYSLGLRHNACRSTYCHSNFAKSCSISSVEFNGLRFSSGFFIIMTFTWFGVRSSFWLVRFYLIYYFQQKNNSLWILGKLLHSKICSIIFQISFLKLSRWLFGTVLYHIIIILYIMSW